MRVRAIRLGNGAVTGVEVDGGRRESAEAYVFALPHVTMAELANEEIRRLEPLLGELGDIGVAPITGVHFWFDREVMKEPFVTLLDTTTQWVFNKKGLFGAGNGKGKEKGKYLELGMRGFCELLA